MKLRVELIPPKLNRWSFFERSLRNLAQYAEEDNEAIASR